MPTVPVYGGPQVQRQALRTPQQGQIDASSGLQGLARGLDVVADVTERRIVRDAEAEANRIDEEMTAGWLTWEAENRRKFQGANAADYGKAAEDWWNKAGESYAKDMTPLVSRAVSPTMARKRGRALASAAEYVNAEGERHADEQSERAALRSIEFGVDTGDYAGAAAQVRRINAQKAARKGWTPEQLEIENVRLVGALHLTAIEKLAETNAAAANAYYERVKGEVPAAAQNKVESVLKAEGDNQFATQFAAANASKPLTAQLEDAAKITDPERREKTITQVRNTFALKRQAQQEQESMASDEAWQLASQGRRVPESTLLRMNGRERAQLKDWLREKAEKGVAVKTDWGAYIEAREALAAGQPVNLRALTTKIAGPQLEQLLDLQTKAKTNPKEITTDEQQLAAHTRQMGLKDKQLGQYQAAAQDAFNTHQKRTGKAPTYEERQKILDALTQEVVTHDGWLWDSKDPLYKQPKPARDAKLGGETPRVKTVEEARALPKGTRFIDPQGIERIR